MSSTIDLGLVKGAVGATGDKGPTGNTGPTGSTGATGARPTPGNKVTTLVTGMNITSTTGTFTFTTLSFSSLAKMRLQGAALACTSAIDRSTVYILLYPTGYLSTNVDAVSFAALTYAISSRLYRVTVSICKSSSSDTSAARTVKVTLEPVSNGESAVARMITSINTLYVF